jgi:hypothetical protein
MEAAHLLRGVADRGERGRSCRSCRSWRVQTMAILVANVSRKNEGWPKLLSCWGLGDPQVIYRDVHVSKCYFSKLRNALGMRFTVEIFVPVTLFVLKIPWTPQWRII